MAKPNPYDQFDAITPENEEEQVPKPLTYEPGQNPDEVGFETPSGQPDNIYDSPENLDTETFNPDSFSKELYERIRRNESAPAIMQWALENGQTLNEEDLLENIKIQQYATQNGLQNPTLGRVMFDDEAKGLGGGTVKNLGTMLRTSGNMMLFNLGDELASAAGAAAQSAAGQGDFGENYEKNWLMLDAQDQLDARMRPEARTAGTILGVAGSMMVPGAIFDKGVRTLAPRIGVSPAANLGARAAVGTGTGAVSGAVAATGEGSPDDRFEHTGGGAVVGGTIGAAFPLVAAGVGRLARPIRERLFGNPDRAMGDRFQLTQEELAGMEAELQRQRDLGMEPSLLDVLPQRARNIVGGMGHRDGVREILQDEAQSRTENLGSRVRQRVEENVGPTNNPDFVNEDIGRYRDERMNEQMEAIRDNAVIATDDLLQVLDTTQGRSAIQRAIDAEPDPRRRAAMNNVLENLHLARQIPPNMSPTAREQMERQIFGGQGGVSVGFLDRIRQELRRAAKQGDTDYAAVSALASTVERAAKQDPQYATALRQYSSRSRAMEASSVGTGGERERQRVTGFLNEEPEAFEDQVSGLRRSYGRDFTNQQAQDELEEVNKLVGERLEQQYGYGANSDEARRAYESDFRQAARSRGIHEDEIQRYLSNPVEGDGALVSEVRMRSRRRDTRGSLEAVPDRRAPRTADGRSRYEVAQEELTLRASDERVKAEQMTDDELARKVVSVDPNDYVTRRALFDEINKRRYRAEQDADWDAFNRWRDVDEFDMANDTYKSDLSRQNFRDGMKEMNNDPDSVIRRFQEQRGPENYQEIEYTLQDGSTLTAELKMKPNGDVAIITVHGINDHAGVANTYGPAVMKEVASLIREQYPQIRYIAGQRVTGARANTRNRPTNPFQVVPARPLQKTQDAPTEIQLARQGAAHSVGREAGKGPAQAEGVAKKLVRSDDQRRRTDTLIGAEAGERLRAQLDEELKRVYRATRQMTPESPSGEDKLAIVESGVNAMYSPTSPVPWIREGMRFLHKIGIREEDAKYIAEAAIDQNRTEELIERLQKHGMNREQAAIWLDEFRDATVKYFTTQEG